MHKFVRNLLTEWRKLKLPFEDAIFIVAVSGGADSVSLLLALHELREAKKLRANFIVAHFNHDLRGEESRRDAEFVRDLCQKLEISLITETQNPESKIQDQKGNLEQLARHARFEFFTRAAEIHKAFGFLTAHTLNDQAETFLLNLIRGSGAAGLGAIKSIRKLNAQTDCLLIRPLLNWAERKDTENFARDRKVEFRLDSMNDDKKFSRVKIRKTVIPLLREFNPKIVRTLAQTATLLQENTGQFSFETDDLSESLAIKELKNLSKPMIYAILRAWLEKRRGDLRQIDLKHVQAIENLIFSRKSGRIVELPNREIVVKKQGKLFLEKRKVEKSGSDN